MNRSQNTVWLEIVAPCPFCEVDRMVQVRSRGDQSFGETYACRCQKCGAWGPRSHDPVESVRAWVDTSTAREYGEIAMASIAAAKARMAERDAQFLAARAKRNAVADRQSGRVWGRK